MTDDASAPAEPPAAGDEPIRVVMLSGFLGAGKTTALHTVGARLTERGYTVGMITNDQASGLVDTSILDRTADTVVEIPGGCFCCNFEQLLRAAHTIEAEGVDLVLAEPVGSCTDLVATVLNPLQQLHDDAFTVAPLTTVLDPDRVASYLTDGSGALPEAVEYIFRLQIEEADVLLLNKVDTLDDATTARLVERLQAKVGDRPVIPVSAAEQDGLDEWLSLVVDGAGPASDGDAAEGVASRALTDIDYDTYADGEAELGWVNLTVTLEGTIDTAQFQRALMHRLQRALGASGIEVAHLKFALAAEDALAHANLTATDGDPQYSGPDLGTVTASELVVNARAVGAPEEIRTIAEDAIAAATPEGVAVTIETAQAFRPAYPEPTHRLDGEPAAE